MAQWGRNDQSVTANSTTTKESSNGAPLGTYALVKGSGNGVNPVNMDANSHFGNTSGGSRANVDVAMFNNTTPGVFIPGQAVGVFGVSPTEMSNNITNSSKERPAHAGWSIRKAGTGPVVGVSISGTPVGYNNNDILTVTSAQSGGNSTINFSTNSTGGSLTFTITTPGAGFTNSTINSSMSLMSITNSTGGTAAGNSSVTNITVTVGGRAGRVMTETLVAFGSLGVNSTTSTGVVGNIDTVTDATTDNNQYPGA